MSLTFCILVAANLISELTYKLDVLHRIINFDETHHKKSTEGDKGGSRSTTLTKPDLPRFGSRFAKDNGDHVTGVYGSPPLEPMPPVIIFKTTATDPKRIRVKPDWVKNLPTVVGKWGFEEVCEMGAHFASRPNGSMEDTLFMKTVLFYASMYEDTLAPTFKWDGDRLVEGPLLIKGDSGAGRNAKSVESIEFRRKMHLKGVYLMPGLPNATGVSQEMDNLYSIFKGDTDAKAEQIFERKTFERAKIVSQLKDTPEIEIPVAHLTNDNIPEIINGKPGDAIEDRPFDNSFTPKKLWGSWVAIGFTPFTRKALLHKKVRRTLGEGGASKEMKEVLESVSAKYADLKEKVKGKGLNEFVFNAKLPFVRKNARLEKTKQEQIQSLVKNKGAFSAGAQWCNVGLELLGAEAVVTAQLEQLDSDAKKVANAAAKKATQSENKLKKAEDAVKVFKSIDKSPGKDEWKNIIMFLLPRIDKTTAPSKVSSIKKAKEKLAQLAIEHEKPWLAIVEEELNKARAEAPALEGAAEEDRVRAELWEDLEIDREEVLGPEDPEDIQLTAV